MKLMVYVEVEWASLALGLLRNQWFQSYAVHKSMMMMMMRTSNVDVLIL